MGVFSCTRSGCYLLGEFCKPDGLRLIFGDTVLLTPGQRHRKTR